MKHIFLILLCITFVHKIIYAQKVTFDYNKTGARILRETEIQKTVIQTSVEIIPENIIQENSIKLYPNPVKDYLQIELYKQNVHKAVVIDLFGRMVFTLNNLSERNNIDLSHLSSGIYLLKISDKTYKFLKE
ncbi:MAG: T9SS type A sorting domain-containing protein [Bacteroidales bacterium]|nr:T9SS type A sorting domain-containing protein [Bacteroidales bacterium]